MKNHPIKEPPHFNQFLIDHIDAIIFLVNVDQKGILTYEKINKAHERATGLSNDYLRGKTPIEALGEQAGRNVEAKYRRCLKESKPVTYEETLVLPAGQRTWLTKLSPIFEHGRIVQIAGVSTDITERKENEEIQNNLYQRINAGLKAGNLSWWEMEMPSGNIKFDDRKAEMLGYSPDEFNHYEDFMCLVHRDDYDATMQAMRNHIKGETDIYEVAYRIKEKSGQYRWFKDFGNITERDADKGTLKIIGIIQDITEQKTLEIALRGSEEKFRNLFEKHLAVQLLVDSETNYILDANEAAVKYYGYTKAELKQMKISQINTLSPEEMKIEMEKALTNQRVYFQFKHRLANGEVRDVEVFSNHLEIDGKKVIHAIIHDITEQKKNERALIEAKHLAEAANIAKSEFLSTMSHELRTPLNGVIGFSEILKFTGLTEEQNEYVNTVLSSAKNLLAIISDILNFSTIEAKSFALNPEKTDLKELIRKTCSMVQRKAVKKGLAFSVDIAEDVSQIVEVDSGKLRQILMNLLSNAVKFTKVGGVSIKLNVIEKQDGKAKLLFKVTDTGIGIKEMDQKAIFEAFRQVDMSTTRRYEGAGLGLTINKNLLQKMDSTLNLISTYGKGSTFSFELQLPYEEEKEADSDIPEVEDTVKALCFKNKKILIAEDNAINMRYAQTALSIFSKDIQILTAKNGKEAYKQYLEHKPDMILMDIIMPGIDGYQATKMIRQHDTQIPIIAMTAKAYQEDKADSLAAGMNDYITKPVSLDQLKEILKRHMGAGE